MLLLCDAVSCRHAGKQVWTYWASEPGSGPGASAHSSNGWGTNGTWLNTFLQWPSIAPRLLFWLGALIGTEGWLYWVANNWISPVTHTGIGQNASIQRINGTLLTDASKVSDSAIGDGVLFYIHGSSPVPGLRYINLADGIEDQHLFAQCGASCSDLLRRLVRSGDEWRDAPLMLEATRREAARRVMALKGLIT